MSCLDDVEALRKADVHGMLAAYLRWADNLLEAAKRAEDISFPAEVRTRAGPIRYGEPDAVVIVGMGGSVVGGELLKDLTWDVVPVPVLVWRDYHMPAFAGPDTLVIAVSYSGNTEETLMAFSEALGRKCMIAAITSGGILGQLCKRLGIPVVEVPAGLKPRMALPYLFAPLPVLLEKLGLAKGLKGQVEEAAALLRHMAEDLGPDVPTARNKAKELASELKGTIPIVYGFGFFRSVAYRLKTQFNENSKVPSFYNWLPALNHDEVMGWEAEDALTKPFSVIFIRDRDEALEIRHRIEATKELVAGKASKVLELHALGSERLEKMLSVLYVGEMASLYLALARGVDPYAMASIDDIKEKLAVLGMAEKARARAEALVP